MPLEMLPVAEESTQSKGVEFRVLTPEEISSIAHVFADQGASLPDPTVSQFVGAVEDGKVVGFLVLQLRLHAEPMWIESKHSQVFTKLVAEAEKIILRQAGPQWVYLFAPAGRTAQLAQSMGMQLEPWVVLSKLVMPNIPDNPVFNLLDVETEGVQ
jgi:hypothetical protein